MTWTFANGFLGTRLHPLGRLAGGISSRVKCLILLMEPVVVAV